MEGKEAKCSTYFFLYTYLLTHMHTHTHTEWWELLLRGRATSASPSSLHFT